MDYLKSHQIDLNNITKESVHECGYGVKAPEEMNFKKSKTAGKFLNAIIEKYINIC